MECKQLLTTMVSDPQVGKHRPPPLLHGTLAFLAFLAAGAAFRRESATLVESTSVKCLVCTRSFMQRCVKMSRWPPHCTRRWHQQRLTEGGHAPQSCLLDNATRWRDEMLHSYFGCRRAYTYPQARQVKLKPLSFSASMSGCCSDWFLAKFRRWCSCIRSRCLLLVANISSFLHWFSGLPTLSNVHRLSRCLLWSVLLATKLYSTLPVRSMGLYFAHDSQTFLFLLLTQISEEVCQKPGSALFPWVLCVLPCDWPILNG